MTDRPTIKAQFGPVRISDDWTSGAPRVSVDIVDAKSVKAREIKISESCRWGLVTVETFTGPVHIRVSDLEVAEKVAAALRYLSGDPAGGPLSEIEEITAAAV